MKSAGTVCIIGLVFANRRAGARVVRPVQPTARPPYSRELRSRRGILEQNLERWRRLICKT